MEELLLKFTKKIPERKE